MYVPTGCDDQPGIDATEPSCLKTTDDTGVDLSRWRVWHVTCGGKIEAAAADSAKAIAAARKATGLTRSTNQCMGGMPASDYSTWPGLDMTARELAGMYPELGIGRGYVEAGTGYDDTDYAGQPVVFVAGRQPAGKAAA